MRRNLLAMVALATAASALAIAPNQQSKNLVPLTGKNSVINKANQKVTLKDLAKNGGMLSQSKFAKATRAEETLNMHWGYCGDPYSAFQLDDNEINQAIYVNEEITEMLDGAVLKSVLTVNPADASDFDRVNWTYGNPVKTCTVWVKESLDGEPVVQGTGEMGSYGFDWSTIALDETYTIQKGKGFYVGVSLTVPEEKYPNTYAYSFDYIWPEYDDTNLVYSTIVGYDDDGFEIVEEQKKWTNMGYDYGNACIRLDVYGDNLPTNIAIIQQPTAPAYVAPGDKVPVMFYVVNKGANDINNVEISFQYEGEEALTATSLMYLGYDEDDNLVSDNIPYGYYGIAMAEFDSPKAEGNYSYEIKVTKINGEADNNSDSSLSGYILCLAEGYHKNVVVEEATGTWCGWCPAGWAGMEYIKEAFAEEGVIGIALHGGDPMSVLDEEEAYYPLYDYIDGFPSCFYNRDMANSGYPAPDYIEEDLDALVEIPACATISATLEAGDDANTVKLSTKSEFMLNGDEGEYEVAYAVVEDGVGPYMQTNYFSGDPDDESYGFGSKTDPCPLKFNDVARNCSQPMGIEGSLPAVEKGKSYEFGCEITLDDVKKVENCRVVAMVINKKSGYIENAVQVNHPANDGNAVKSITASNSSSFIKGVKGGILIDGDHSNVNIYSASGMKVAKANGFRVNLPAGIYFVTRGSESVKVVVK